MEHAVEIGRKHPAPFLLGALDEGFSAASADAGIGKAAVDAAESVEGRLHRLRNGRGIGDVADACIDLAGALCHRRRCGLVLLRITAPDRDVAATRRKGLRHTEPDTAITAGDDRDAARKVEHAHWCLPLAFPFSMMHQPRAVCLPVPWPTTPQRSNMALA